MHFRGFARDPRHEWERYQYKRRGEERSQHFREDGKRVGERTFEEDASRTDKTILLGRHKIASAMKQLYVIARHPSRCWTVDCRCCRYVTTILVNVALRSRTGGPVSAISRLAGTREAIARVQRRV